MHRAMHRPWVSVCGQGVLACAAWSMHGVCMVYAWYMHGVCMVCWYVEHVLPVAPPCRTVPHPGRTLAAAPRPHRAAAPLPNFCHHHKAQGESQGSIHRMGSQPPSDHVTHTLHTPTVAGALPHHRHTRCRSLLGGERPARALHGLGSRAGPRGTNRELTG